MNTAKTWQTESLSSEDTSAIGERLGLKCRGGEVFLLVSDLGGGKTTFTKGLAKGLGFQGVVGSPTFTLERAYPCRDGLTLHHFDFYRLQEAGVVAYELSEVIDDPKAVIVVEWGNIVGNVLPLEHIKVQFDRLADGEDLRKISLQYPSKFTYVCEEL